MPARDPQNPLPSPVPPVAPTHLRLQLVSDLHVDVADTRRLRLAPDADVVAVAGDTCEGVVEAFAHLRQRIPAPTPIVMVAGNHEAYGRCLPDELARARATAPDYDIIFLENDAVMIGGVRILGCTLWTDFRLFGERHRAVAMAAAPPGLADHRAIARAIAPTRRPFRPEDAAARHAASVGFLREALVAPFAGPTVVITHHAPHPLGIAPQYMRDPLSAAFASDLSALIDSAQPDLWVFGHTHHAVDAVLGRTRLCANPHGYGDQCTARFDPALILEVPLTADVGDRS